MPEHASEADRYVYRVVPIMFGESLTSMWLSNKGDLGSLHELADHELDRWTDSLRAEQQDTEPR